MMMQGMSASESRSPFHSPQPHNNQPHPLIHQQQTGDQTMPSGLLTPQISPQSMGHPNFARFSQLDLAVSSAVRESTAHCYSTNSRNLSPSGADLMEIGRPVSHLMPHNTPNFSQSVSQSILFMYELIS